jgi:hypothetical protein
VSEAKPSHVELEALAGRLREAAARLKEQHAAADDEEPEPEALGATLARLEEAGAAVRDARRRLLELESRLRAS